MNKFLLAHISIVTTIVFCMLLIFTPDQSFASKILTEASESYIIETTALENNSYLNLFNQIVVPVDYQSTIDKQTQSFIKYISKLAFASETTVNIDQQPILLESIYAN